MKNTEIPSRAAQNLAAKLIATLPNDAPGLFNPWRHTCEHDSASNTVDAKQMRWAAHLDVNPRWVLVGEALGYQGCRYSGVAFTSEKLLIDGVIPRIARLDHRLTTRERVFTEPSATVVWKTLHELGIAEHVVAWNALQLHPFRQGDAWTNRTPRRSELDHGMAGLDILIKHFSHAGVVAVGKKAEALLSTAGIKKFHTVRHPSMGGAIAFSTQLRDVVAG